MAARRILVTGVANDLGAQLARTLLDDPAVEQVIGLDTRTPPSDVAARVTHVRADVRSPELGRLLREAEVDAIVHHDIVQFPERGRGARHLHDINVIGTLGLLAAAERLPGLRSIVVRGSAAIYGSAADAPAFCTEDVTERRWAVGATTRFQRDLLELEALVATFARRRPEVPCTVLRPQPIVGPGSPSPVAAMFRTPIVLTAMGYDPRVQVLHAEDALGAVGAALRRPVRGAVNVAGDGVVSLSAALRIAGRRGVPVAPPLLVPVGDALARVGAARRPQRDMLRWLRHGRAVDTTRMREELGFAPRLTTREAIAATARHHPEEQLA